MSDQELQVGDKIEMLDGPFAATWEVVEIIPAGARLAYQGDVRFVGWKYISTAPNGDDLSGDKDQGFIGRAHWNSVNRMPSR